jgi:hypothetical protein
MAEAHKVVGLEPPTHQAIVRNTLKGIRRTAGTTQSQKAPALTDDIRAMVDATDTGIIGARDRAWIVSFRQVCAAATARSHPALEFIEGQASST